MVLEDLKQYRERADLLKALAHPVRLCIVSGLLREEGCNVNKIKDCLRLPQSTVSQQLAILRAAGIVAGERHGTGVFYRVVDDRVRRLVALLRETTENDSATTALKSNQHKPNRVY